MLMQRQLLARLFIVVLLGLSFGGCVSGTSARPSASISDLSSQKKTDKLNETLMLSAVTKQQLQQKSYTIGPEDLLEIDAYNVDELKKTVRVNSLGEINLPLVGVLAVRGLTTTEAERLITKKLGKYIEETVVTVFIKEYKSQKITVVGAVKNPGTFTVTGQQTLIDMLMLSGGISNDSGNTCYILRHAENNGQGNDSEKVSPEKHAETIIIDIDDLLINGNLALNIPVFSGDVINIPRGGVIFVDGEVKSPGVYPIRGKIVLTKAIALAHGISPDALQNEVRIFRDNAKGEKDIITADYEAIRDGKKPDIALLENDVVIVPVNGTKVFFKKFVGTMGRFVNFGITGNYNVLQ
jgi:polysaccharide export outer membrane protein